MTDAPLQVLFIGHEASRTGAPVGFLSLMNWFKSRGVASPHIWLRHAGPLTEAHAAIGPLAVGASGEWPQATERTAQLAYLNTATLGGYAEVLANKNIPVLCHVHEMEYGLRVTGERNLRQLRQHVARFIACSHAVKSALIRVLEIDGSKIDVVPECVDVERALRLSQEAILAPQLPANARVIAGMGTVNWRKGTDLFLRVLASLNRDGETWHGVWVGDLDSAPDRDQLLHDMRVLGVADKVRFTGSQANPFPHLIRANVYCLTSREDPYPLAMVEAAALGLPIVGFRGSGGVEEFAAEAGGVVVDYADTTAMAEAVRACAKAPPQNGRTAAERLCLPAVVGSTIASIMRGMAAPQAVPLDGAVVAKLQSASLPAVRSKVQFAQGDGAGQAADLECDLTAESKVRLVTSWPNQKSALLPVITLSIEPQDRSVVLSQFQVRLSTAEHPAGEPVRVKIRTGGRAMLCGDEAPKSWLCLDGKGRLMVELKLPEELATAGNVEIAATWDQSIHIKEALAPLLKMKAAPPPKRQGPLARLWQKIVANEPPR